MATRELNVRAVAPRSAAARAGVRPGDIVLAVNGRPVRDNLDFVYRAAEESVRLRVRRRDGRRVDLRLMRAPGEDLGVTLGPDRVARCSNRCVFCFIDQNPRGLRRSLYVKDEDYRLSLLYGNYVALTGIARCDLRRIITQRLSPLYVSVHATDPEARRRLLRSRGDADIRPLLAHLARGHIRMHAQIVLVPGYNDGPVLERTLDDLERLHPAIASVAIVPVGLTRHRERLTPLRRMTAREARRLLAMLAIRRESALTRLGTRLHFAADEIYFLAGRPLPRAVDYEGFTQIENGVGMARRFESDLRTAGPLLPEAADMRALTRSRRRRWHATVVSGRLFARPLAKYLSRALEKTGESARWRVKVLAAKNDLFGDNVTVAGLLGGADMVAALRNEAKPDLAILPPEAFNQDRLTLDEMTAAAIGGASGTRVQVGFGRGASPREYADRSRNERDPV